MRETRLSFLEEKLTPQHKNAKEKEFLGTKTVFPHHNTGPKRPITKADRNTDLEQI